MAPRLFPSSQCGKCRVCRQLSTVYNSKASQIKMNVTSAVGFKVSPNMNMPRKNVQVGEIYCSRPSVIRRICRAA